MCMSHDDLFHFLKMNFALIQYHKYNLSDIEAMLPYEREIYVSLLIDYLKEEKERLNNKQMAHNYG